MGKYVVRSEAGEHRFSVVAWRKDKDNVVLCHGCLYEDAERIAGLNAIEERESPTGRMAGEPAGTLRRYGQWVELARTQAKLAGKPVSQEIEAMSVLVDEGKLLEAENAKLNKEGIFLTSEVGRLTDAREGDVATQARLLEDAKNLQRHIERLEAECATLLHERKDCEQACVDGNLRADGIERELGHQRGQCAEAERLGLRLAADNDALRAECDNLWRAGCAERVENTKLRDEARLCCLGVTPEHHVDDLYLKDEAEPAPACPATEAEQVKTVPEWARAFAERLADLEATHPKCPDCGKRGHCSIFQLRHPDALTCGEMITW